MRESEQAYVEYVTSRLPALRRLGYHLCGTTAGADDLVQETITKVFVHWTRIRAVDDMHASVRHMLLRTFLAGLPLCLDCYDHDHQVVWNHTAGELWRHTRIGLERHLNRSAKAKGVDPKRITPPTALPLVKQFTEGSSSPGASPSAS